MQSSDPTYTSIKQRSSRRWVGSTVFLGVLAIAGGIGVDLWLNPVAEAPIQNAISESTAPIDATATGDAVEYRYGAIQLEVVRSGGKLTEVKLIQAGANGGREAAFPYLQQYALDAQGSSFGNLSGATFTVDAFKQALDSAISKLG